MHPREGWRSDGTPPRPGLSRRSFLKGSAASGLLLGSAGSVLAACGSGSGGSTNLRQANTGRAENPTQLTELD